ncbi:MAG TPA: ABC transporter permease subunit, partial [Actinomycetota bacterium]
PPRAPPHTMSDTATVETARPPLWRNVRVLRMAGQILFLLAVLFVGREIWLNLVFGVESQNIDLSFSFLRQRAGFGIKEGIEYSANDTVTRALIVAFVNTIIVAGTGIALATFFGLLIGIGRLSPNWLVRKVTQVYVEIFRNTPVLVIIIFFYFGVVLALPLIGGGGIFGLAYLSNRGAAFPWPRTSEGVGLWTLLLVAAVVAATLVARWRTRVNERTGEPHHRVLWWLGMFLGLGAVAYALTGAPLTIDVPDQVGRGYVGGIQISGELFGVLAGLVIYTSAFIAEITRGSILAVDKGQKEAGEALGLTPFQQMRFVVLPQAMRIAIPPINSQYLNLTKNTSLGLAVAYPELVSVGSTIINQKGRFTQVLIIWMLAYLTLSLAISFLMNILNRIVAYRGARR